MTNEEKIQQLKSLQDSYCSKEISCNVASEIERHQFALLPEIKKLKTELEADGYEVVLHSASTVFHGGEAATVRRA